MTTTTRQTDCTSSAAPSTLNPTLSRIISYPANSATVPNRLNSVSPGQGPFIDRASIALYIFALIFVALRLYARICIAKSHGADDYLIVAATLLVTVSTAMMFMQVAHDWGKHAFETSLEHLNKTQLYRWIFMLTSYFSLFAIHESICCLVLRMARGATTFGKEYRTVIWAVMIVVFIRFLVETIVHISQCIPINRFWQLEIRPKGCINIALWAAIASFLNSITDIILFALPIPLIHKIQIHIRQKVVLFIIFLTGLIPIVASLVRSVHLIQSYLDMAGWFERDTSWRWALIPFWSQVETTLGIISACIPTLNPLMKTVLKRLGLRTTTHNSSHRTSRASEPTAADAPATNVRTSNITAASYLRRRNSRNLDPEPGDPDVDVEPSYPFRSPLDPDDDDLDDDYFGSNSRRPSHHHPPRSRTPSARPPNYLRTPPRLGFVNPAPSPSPSSPTLVGTDVQDFAPAPPVLREGGGGNEEKKKKAGGVEPGELGVLPDADVTRDGSAGVLDAVAAFGGAPGELGRSGLVAGSGGGG